MNRRTFWAVSALLAMITLPLAIHKTYQGWLVYKYGVIVESTVVFLLADDIMIELQGKTYKKYVGDDSRADFHVGEKLRMKYLPGEEPLFEKQNPLVWGAIWLFFTLLWGIVSVWKFRRKPPQSFVIH